MVLRHTFRERRPQRLQRVIGAWSPVVEGGTDEVELLLQRADPDSEDHPAVAHPVEGAVPLGDLQRMVVGEDEHVRREPDALGASREVPEGGERIPVHRSAAGELGSRQRDVLAAREVVVAEAVSRLGDSGQILDRPIVGPPGARRHDG